MDDWTGLSELIDISEQDGMAWAQADSDYYKAKAKCAARYKAAGCPVGYIDMIIRGDEDVMAERLKLKMAEVTYKASKERLLAKKAEIKAMNDGIRFQA